LTLRPRPGVCFSGPGPGAFWVHLEPSAVEPQGREKEPAFSLDEIKIFFPSLFLPRAEGARSAEKIPLFRSGDVVQGKVLQQVDPHHFSLQLGSRTLVVESNVPLPISADLSFRVEETGPRTFLKLIPPESAEEQKMVSFLKKALSTDMPLEQLAKKLSELGNVQWIPPGEKESWKQFLRLLRQFTPSELMTRGPQLLPELFSQSGFFWENKIRQWIEGGRKDAPEYLAKEDLKGLGLKLLAQLQGLSGSSDAAPQEFRKMESLKQTLESLLQKIELHQVLNLRTADSSDRFYLFLPFWMGNQLQFVEFNLSHPSKNSPRGDGNEFSVLFLLHLPEFGEVRIEVRIKEKALFCRFVVSAEEVSEFLQQRIPLLQEGLEKLGFQPSIQMATGPGEKEKEFFPRDMDGDSQTLLSVVI
jgi:hypothetical protein